MKHTRHIANAPGQNTTPTRMGVLTVLLLLCISGTAMHAEAADKKASREREALRRVQQQLSHVQGEMTAIEQEKSRLMADLEQARASSSSVESKAARLQHGLNASKQQLSALTQELVLVKEELVTTAKLLDETRKSLDETAQALQQAKAEKNHLEGTRERNERELASCERKNVALYGVGRSLMDRFESKTCGETLAQKEPFTGLKQVETENLLEEYRDKLDDQKYIKAPGG